MAPYGQESVSTAPVSWRKWLVFSHPVLRRFSLAHAARLREWPEGLQMVFGCNGVDLCSHSPPPHVICSSTRKR